MADTQQTDNPIVDLLKEQLAAQGVTPEKAEGIQTALAAILTGSKSALTPEQVQAVQEANQDPARVGGRDSVEAIFKGAQALGAFGNGKAG